MGTCVKVPPRSRAEFWLVCGQTTRQQKQNKQKTQTQKPPQEKTQKHKHQNQNHNETMVTLQTAQGGIVKRSGSYKFSSSTY